MDDARGATGVLEDRSHSWCTTRPRTSDCQCPDRAFRTRSRSIHLRGARSRRWSRRPGSQTRTRRTTRRPAADSETRPSTGSTRRRPGKPVGPGLPRREPRPHFRSRSGASREDVHRFRSTQHRVAVRVRPELCVRRSEEREREGDGHRGRRVSVVPATGEVDDGPRGARVDPRGRRDGALHVRAERRARRRTARGHAARARCTLVHHARGIACASQRDDRYAPRRRVEHAPVASRSCHVRATWIAGSKVTRATAPPAMEIAERAMGRERRIASASGKLVRAGIHRGPAELFAVERSSWHGHAGVARADAGGPFRR